MCNEIFKIVAIAALLLFLLSGCMAFQSNDARRYNSFPPPNIQALKEPKSIFIATRYQIAGLDTYEHASKSSADYLEGLIEDKLEKTGVFIVHPEAKTADYRLCIRVRDDADGNLGMAMLTGFTLYIIPSTSTDSYTTDFKLIDQKGNLIANKRSKHELVLWQQLFLIFGLPFATLNEVEDDMWQEVFEDAAVWAAENAKDGILSGVERRILSSSHSQICT